MHEHHYKMTITWTGNKGEGTATYKSYERSHTVSAANKQVIAASSDPAYRGDPTRYNPEELLVAALSSCHMLSYLHLCATAGVVVTDYVDEATGTMVDEGENGGHFTGVTLYPVITVTDKAMIPVADALHEKAHKVCFIANSCNFPVHHKPVFKVAGAVEAK